MSVLTTILGVLLAGLIVGVLARLIVPGTKGMKLGVTVLLGVAGALVGTLVYRLFGGGVTDGVDWFRFGAEILTAAVFVAIYAAVKKPKRW
ncbi:MAG: GlsB/YeaQ/YmgE family stress response membrane protein [Candidatus Nanopelagicales bacterium]